MAFAAQIDFAMLMEPVAQRLLGEPNKQLSKPPKELRFGTHGSMSVDCELGRFYDHEAKVGGNVVDLVKYKLKCDHPSAVSWLRREGFLDNTPRPHPQRPVNGEATSRLRPRSDQRVHDAPKPRFVCTYDYVDEDGTLLHQTVRYADSKCFKQRRPNPEKFGEWVWDLNGARRVLYRLPSVVAAVASGEPIFLPEGEKDADNLCALGLAATTNPMGAGKWRPEYSNFLRGADVVLIEDNDEAGRNHVEAVAAFLDGVARRIRMLHMPVIWPECPEKTDISDWLAAGGTAEKLNDFVASLPDWKPRTASELAEQPWPVMDKAAYHGLAGDIVRTIAPHTEADPAAILIQTVVYFGSLIGHGPHYSVEASRHGTNMFAALVGKSSKARKGTSGDRVRSVAVVADKSWCDERIKSGLSTGEGLIGEVRDPVKKWDPKAKAFDEVDPGVADKRLMIVEAEFAGILSVMERPGNNLSPVVRKAWDGGRLSTLTKNSPLCATDPHISIVGHITEEELRARLTRTDAANGFGNRFLFTLVKRARLLPFGGSLDPTKTQKLGERLRAAAEAARQVGLVSMTHKARTAWAEVYGELSADRPGLLGAVTARAEAQVIRLAMIYALLDKKTQIDVPHLRAALALWEYCQVSAEHIFGGSLGDPVADEILAALRRAGGGGLSRTAISDLFGRNQTKDRIGAALALLLKHGKARGEMRTTGGRAAEFWFALNPRGTK
jgi:hypothetical protein